jgi:predicted small integral membrane protein
LINIQRIRFSAPTTVLVLALFTIMISITDFNRNFVFVQNATLISSASQLFGNIIEDVQLDASSDKQDIPLNGSIIKLE